MLTRLGLYTLVALSLISKAYFEKSAQIILNSDSLFRFAIDPEKVNSSISLLAYVSKNEISEKLDEILKKFGTDKNYMHRFFNDRKFGYKELTNMGLHDSEKMYPGIVEGLKILLSENGDTETFGGKWENSNYKRPKQGIKIGKGIILLGLLTGLSLGLLIYCGSKAFSKNQESN